MKSHMAAILERIDAIVEEMRELRNAQALPRRPFNADQAMLNPIQERALQVLAEKDEMTSVEVAKAVERTRPLMVINLNQLVALGFLEKVRKGRRVYFRLKQREEPSIIGEGIEKEGCYLFAVLASDSWPEDVDDLKLLISERLKHFPEWRLEHMTLLPRGQAEDQSGDH